MPSSLLPRLLAQLPDHRLPATRPGRRRLAITGLSKNAGKTTTLNHLLQTAAAVGIHANSLGLITTGRDGEATDAVTDLPKPSIWAPAGALVVTAREAARASSVSIGGHVSANANTSNTHGQSAVLDELAELPWETQWGPMTLNRVRHPGTVTLIGPGSTARLQHCIEQLEAAGATLTLIDGSLDRLAAATPGITDGVLLACGAAAGDSTARIAELAANRAALLQLPEFTLPQAAQTAKDFIAKAHAATARGEIVPTLAAIEVEGRPDSPSFRLRPLAVTTAVGHATAVVKALDRARILLIAGALPASLLVRLNLETALVKHLHIVVGDGTRVQPDMMAWRKFHRLGGNVWAANPIRLLGLTSNPWRPDGPPEDAAVLLQALHEAVPGVPVCDLHRGRCLP